MFLVLIEYVEDGGNEWSVMTHGQRGSVLPTREEAEAIAVSVAKKQGNRFSVVEIKSWFQQEVQRVEVKETRIG